MRAGGVLVLAILLLAGCAAPAATRDDASAAASALPSSLDVDLHEFVVNITMPEGEPTMIVALNVTTDMWVRPIVVSAVGSAVPSDAFWILCPWLRSLGLPAAVNYRVFPFWLNGAELRAAMGVPEVNPEGGWNSTNDGRCVASDQAALRAGAIASDDPIDGILVLLVAAHPAEVALVPDSLVTPRFQFHVAIATTPCEDRPEYCPPTTEAPASPLRRGGLAAHARYDTMWGACTTCGFDVEETWAIEGDVAHGSVHATRTGAVAAGITFASTGTVATVLTGDVREPTKLVPQDAGPFARASVMASIAGDDHVRITCEDATNPWAQLLVGHNASTAARYTFGMTGTYEWSVTQIEIPIDLEELRLRSILATSASTAPAPGAGGACE